MNFIIFPIVATSFIFPPIIHNCFFSTSLVFVVFFITVILKRVNWYLIMVLVCISPMITILSYLFMCLLSICMPFLKNVYSAFPHILPIFQVKDHLVTSTWFWFLILISVKCSAFQRNCNLTTFIVETAEQKSDFIPLISFWSLEPR